MYKEILPILTKGGFAKYYGGCNLLNQLTDQGGSPVSPIFMSLSVAFQISSLIFKVRLYMVKLRNHIISNLRK